jgi:acyl-coenzyme A synthetase/AMP-(fatty) acid ligase
MRLSKYAEDVLPNELPLTIRDILFSADAKAPAIGAPGKFPLSYQQLLGHAEDVAARLRGLGVGRDDRVAIVLPNGPEMAVAFLASALCGTAAPLNPAYRRDELDFYLNDLDARPGYRGSRSQRNGDRACVMRNPRHGRTAGVARSGCGSAATSS